MLLRAISVSIAALTLALTVSSQVQAADDNRIVAKVNGNEITHIDIVEAHKLLPEQYRKVPFDQIFPTLLDSVIDTYLTSADGRSKGVTNWPPWSSVLASRKRCCSL